jgi:hypothetical protein
MATWSMMAVVAWMALVEAGCQGRWKIKVPEVASGTGTSACRNDGVMSFDGSCDGIQVGAAAAVTELVNED